MPVAGPFSSGRQRQILPKTARTLEFPFSSPGYPRFGVSSAHSYFFVFLLHNAVTFRSGFRYIRVGLQFGQERAHHREWFKTETKVPLEFEF